MQELKRIFWETPVADEAYFTDRDRLIRIETLVQGLTSVVADHTEALERHIKDEENELRKIRVHMTQAVAVALDVETMKKDVRELQTMKNRALGWIAAVIFAGGIFWELVIHPIKSLKGG